MHAVILHCKFFFTTCLTCEKTRILTGNEYLFDMA